MDDKLRVQFQLRAPAIRSRQQQSERPTRSTDGKLPRVTQVLALALQFDEMIRTGQVKHYAELARRGSITRERISQIMELIWLAPDLQTEILSFLPTPAGRHPVSEVAARRIAAHPDWEQQREEWAKLKSHNHLGQTVT